MTVVYSITKSDWRCNHSSPSPNSQFACTTWTNVERCRDPQNRSLDHVPKLVQHFYTPNKTLTVYHSISFWKSDVRSFFTKTLHLLTHGSHGMCSTFLDHKAGHVPLRRGFHRASICPGRMERAMLMPRKMIGDAVVVVVVVVLPLAHKTHHETQDADRYPNIKHHETS